MFPVTGHVSGGVSFFLHCVLTHLCFYIYIIFEAAARFSEWAVVTRLHLSATLTFLMSVKNKTDFFKHLSGYSFEKMMLHMCWIIDKLLTNSSSMQILAYLHHINSFAWENIQFTYFFTSVELLPFI